MMACTLEADPIDRMEKMLRCTVCLETLKDPRTLPCGHSFCRVCLDGVVKTCRDESPHGQPLREFNCPYCLDKFTLDPDKQASDMPQNHFICNLVEATALLDPAAGVPCSHDCRKSFSIARCVTCEKFLCRNCLTGHNNYRGNANHSVLSMEELSKPENREKIKGKILCDKHSGMTLKVYCETCNKLICKDCMHFTHMKPDHCCFLVKDVANNYKEKLALNNKAMEIVINEGNAYLRNLSLKTERLDRDAQNAKSKIVQRKDVVMKKVTEILDRQTEALLSEVDKIHREERIKLDSRTEETKLDVRDLTHSFQLCSTLVDQGTEEEIISSQQMMVDNAKKLLSTRPAHFKAPLPDAKLSYTPRTDREPLTEEIATMMTNCLGDVFEGSKEIGNQPKGNMFARCLSTHLLGFKSCGTIIIQYEFPSGIQGPNHPNPGQPYEGTDLYAYLPSNEEGKKVLRLLRRAFDQKLTFTIAVGQTTTESKNRKDFVTWNDIHHKTSPVGGPRLHGYPDPNYLWRIQEVLSAKGITE